jgi:hypothetical protein
VFTRSSAAISAAVGSVQLLLARRVPSPDGRNGQRAEAVIHSACTASARLERLDPSIRSSATFIPQRQLGGLRGPGLVTIGVRPRRYW